MFESRSCYMKTTLTFVRSNHEMFHKGDIITMNNGEVYKCTGVIDNNTLTIRRTYMGDINKFIKYGVIIGLAVMGGMAIYFSGLYDAVRAMF